MTEMAGIQAIVRTAGRIAVLDAFAAWQALTAEQGRAVARG